ncbi:SurA N-terminal domain-containing protein [Nocardioides coralli]|uniref:SurA N-terminal domain-containing protein n=1 Tax=Nocardioides coralli TaxID=2872154 RepID=UPI001CA3AF4E|nr:SurA N-terminal domain-containing protein [Nocardioides coralli]QZY29113.1 SurA N-terminal domain-containing protein [Nocardioides coralli]
MARVVFPTEVSELLKKTLALALVLLLAGGTAWGVLASRDDSEPAPAAEGSAGVPDVPDVVAEVNGTEIPEADFVEAYRAREQALARQAQASGGGEQPGAEQLTDEVVQSLVNEELLSQEAERRGIDPTDQQVEATLTELAGQSGLASAEELVSALEKQGLDSEEIDEQATQQTRFDLLVADEAGEVAASDKEVRALYDQLSQQSGGQGGQQVPPLKQIRPQLEAQVASQKESEAARALLDSLREDAEITLHV